MEKETITKKGYKPCDCPKGGLWENEDGSYYTCEKCGGDEWVKIKPEPKVK